jgi:hypothetical protein
MNELINIIKHYNSYWMKSHGYKNARLAALQSGYKI